MTVRELLARLAPVIGSERAQKLWRAYLAGDGTDRRELEGALEAYAARLLEDRPDAGVPGLFPPPPPETCQGGIMLGDVLYGGKNRWPFGLRLEELNRHLGLYGSSGSGKSNGIALILDGLRSQGIPYLLCDFKRTFRSLLREDSELVLFTAGDAGTSPFRFNPLIPPPSTSIEVWSKKIISALSHAFMQGAGSESLLVTALERAYAEAANEARLPTFADVSRILEEDKVRGRKAMWMDSARRAITSVSTGNAKDVFCPERPMDIAKLLTRRVILELELLNTAEQTFLSEALLLWVIQYRMNETGPRETLRHAILIEEAHHLLRSPPGVGDGSEPVIHVALREVRELGESVILATQNASVVPVPVFGNQATTLAFHTKHASDVRATAQAMLLKDEAKDELGRLPIGEAIIRAPRWPNPIHVRLSHRPIAKGTVSDAQIRKNATQMACSADSALYHPANTKQSVQAGIPRPDDKDSSIPESGSSQAKPERPAFASPATTPQERVQENGPSELELAMLADIVEHPFDGVVRRIQRQHASRRKGSAALKALEQRGLLKPAHVFTGTSLVKLYDLTKAGRALAHQHNLGPLPDITEGGITHRYWVNHTAKQLQEASWKVKTEHRVSDDLIVDIHAEKDGKAMAILVETGKSNIKANVTKAVSQEYKEIWIITDKPHIVELGEKLKTQYQSMAVVQSLNFGAPVHFALLKQ